MDSHGIQRERRGSTDKRQTEDMARAAETEASDMRRGRIGAKELAYRRHEATPLATHLDDYRRVLLARGNTQDHAQRATRRITRILKVTGARHISDFTLSATQEALGTLRDQHDLADETVNHFVRAIKGFCRWLWKDNRSQEHILAHLATRKAERRHRRRALTAEEAVRLIQVTATGPRNGGLSGPDRSMLYALALGTGFRRNELRSLTPESFHLDAQSPTATVLAGYTTNGEEAVQPLPAPWSSGSVPGWPASGAAWLSSANWPTIRPTCWRSTCRPQASSP
jgi:integrase